MEYVLFELFCMAVANNIGSYDSAYIVHITGFDESLKFCITASYTAYKENWPFSWP